MTDKTDVDNHHPCNKTHCKQCFNEAVVEKVAEIVLETCDNDPNCEDGVRRSKGGGHEVCSCVYNQLAAKEAECELISTQYDIEQQSHAKEAIELNKQLDAKEAECAEWNNVHKREQDTVAELRQEIERLNISKRGASDGLA